MIPPTKRNLLSLAGWAISARSQDCSNQQELSLRKFQDGCAELAQVVDDLPKVNVPRQSTDKKGTVARKARRDPEPVLTFTIPIETEDKVGRAPVGECAHLQFDIRSQKCKSCGISYKQAKGREPELF